MSQIEISQVDERDSSWEDYGPRFRVYLHGSGQTETRGSTDTYDVVGADILQVIDWAQKHAGNSLTYAVALVVDDLNEERRQPGRGRGLLWLIGRDGNDDYSDSPLELALQQRMLQRRTNPVGVPASDAMPPAAQPTYL